jgi:triosephosphate isomerase (TIM)
MRKKIAAGNWKMNKNSQQTQELLNELLAKLPQNATAEILLFPALVNLSLATQQVKGSPIEIGAQNMHEAEAGAFTGEVSADMLTSIGIKTVMIGHSERREIYKESDALLANKVDTALKHNMNVVFCIGEKLEEREDKQQFNVVENQIRDGIFHINKDDFSKIILAYEPVWSIGTGVTASPEQAQEMCSFIRNLISKAFGNKIADEISILYGGSVNAKNAQEIFSQTDIDGGLVGGASLKADEFVTIINAL